MLSLLALAAVLAAAGPSCKEPTQVVVEARTNVDHRSGMTTSFTVGAPGQTEKADPTTETRQPWGADGFIGSLVVVPGTSDDAALSVKIVLAIDRDPRTCTAENDYDGCIVARRRLRYVPGTKLRLPVILHAACVGVPCDESSTCNALGVCVSNDVDPQTCNEAGGCRIPGEGLDPDAGGATSDASSDGAKDDAANDAATKDAAIDVANDAPPTDAGADASDAGGTPGSIDCRSTTCAAPSTHCCYDPTTNSASCVQPTAACVLGSGLIDIRCDDDGDCTSGQQCCWFPSSEAFACGSPAACAATGSRLCHVTPSVCATCTGKVDGYYSYCQ